MEPHTHANSVQLILLFDTLTLLSSFMDQVTIAVNIIYSCSLIANQMKRLVTLVYFTNAYYVVYLRKKTQKYLRKPWK